MNSRAEPSFSFPYKTSDLTFASYLLATQRLPFTGCEAIPEPVGDVAFCFNDPMQEGAAIRAEYDAGAQCSPIEFHRALRRLRRLTTSLTQGQEKEHFRNNQEQRERRSNRSW